MDFLKNVLNKYGMEEDSFYLLLAEALMIYLEFHEEDDEQTVGLLMDVYKHAYRNIFAHYGIKED